MPRAPKKVSFWSKLLSIFGLGKKDGAKPRRDAPKMVQSETQRPSEARKSVPEKFSRKPEAVPVTTPRLYVGNLSYDASESDLQELFSGIGRVVSVEVVYNQKTHRSKGFAFLEMSNVEDARRAVSTLHDQNYMGRKMVVSGAKAMDEVA